MKSPYDHAREAAIVLNMAEIARRIIIQSSGDETSTQIDGQELDAVASNLVCNGIKKRIQSEAI